MDYWARCSPAAEWDGFELAVRTVLGQQVSVQAATTLAGRVASAWGTPIEHSPFDELTTLFPTPEALVEADLERQGVIASRANAIRGLADAVINGRLVFDSSQTNQEFTAKLIAIPGIGPWTAEYISMRARHEPDAFPHSDLGLRKAVSTNSELVTPKRLQSIAETWRPWRAYAAMHLWAAAAAGIALPDRSEPCR